MGPVSGAVVTVLGAAGGGYAVRLAVTPGGGVEPYEVEVLVEPGPPKRATLRARDRLSHAQLADYGSRIGPIAAAVLAARGLDPGPPITVHE